MNNSTQKEEYVTNRLEETLFSESNQSDIIKLIRISIKTFNDDYFEVKEKFAWNTKRDTGLAQHLLIMFEKTRKPSLNQFGFDEFKHIWKQYAESDEYYLQALNDIVNSDDYIFGDRFKLVGGSKKEIRNSNYLSNAMQRWGTFNNNPNKKSVYYSRKYIKSGSCYS